MYTYTLSARRVPRLLASRLPLSVFLFALACSDASRPGAPSSVPTPGSAAALVPITFPAFAPVTSGQQIVMRVTDGSGIRVPGTTVTWAVLAGGGTFAPAANVSDANGLVTTTYTLGETAGAVRLRATIGGSATQDFDTKAVPGPLAELAPLYTDLSLPVGASFSGVVRAVDGYGNGIPGVVLTSRAGDVQYTGLVTTPTEPATVTTDANGNATFRGTVGALPGLQSFLVSGPNPLPTDPKDPGPFQAWFRVRASGSRGYITSLGQWTPTIVGGATREFDVVVIQADGFPAAKAPVVFTASSGGFVDDAAGAVGPSYATLTDNYSGFASAKWRLPVAPGTYSISASTAPPNDGYSPLGFTVTVRAP
jgi:hypothetical protein